jgi:GDPmannose 4,6-dehydratase
MTMNDLHIFSMPFLDCLSNGILFNHESPLRGETFVTRKITRAAAKIALGMQEKLYIGNMDAKRDWGHAKDYVEAMWLMLQQEEPEDFVIATGITTTVRDFMTHAFAEAGIHLRYEGKGVNEKGIIDSIDPTSASNSASASPSTSTSPLAEGQTVIEVDPRYFRPTEVDLLIGDPTKAQEKLGWKPKYNLQGLLEDMVQSDLKLFRRELELKEAERMVLAQAE